MFPSGSCDYNKDVRIILYSTIPFHQYKLKTNVIPKTELSCVIKWRMFWKSPFDYKELQKIILRWY